MESFRPKVHGINKKTKESQNECKKCVAFSKSLYVNRSKCLFACRRNSSYCCYFPSASYYSCCLRCCCCCHFIFLSLILLLFYISHRVHPCHVQPTVFTDAINLHNYFLNWCRSQLPPEHRTHTHYIFIRIHTHSGQMLQYDYSLTTKLKCVLHKNHSVVSLQLHKFFFTLFVLRAWGCMIKRTTTNHLLKQDKHKRCKMKMLKQLQRKKNHKYTLARKLFAYCNGGATRQRQRQSEREQKTTKRMQLCI